MGANLTPRLYGFVALASLALLLAAYAIVWPLNAADAEDWHYIYQGQQRDLFDSPYADNRDFLFIAPSLADMLFPGRFVAIQGVMLFFHWLALLLFFHLMNRVLPGRGGLFFLLIALTIFYIPTNYEQARPSGMIMGSYTLFCVFLSAVLLVEASLRRGAWRWGLVLISGGLAYTVIRMAEIIAPVLVFAPFLMWAVQRRLSRHMVVMAVLWWGVMGIAVLQFLTFYLNAGEDDYTYQTNYAEAGFRPVQLLEDSLHFYTDAFSPAALLDISGNYALPALLVTGLFLLGCWHVWEHHREESGLPGVRLLAVLLGVGVVFSGLAGIGYIYAGVPEFVRSHFMAAPAEALTLLSLFGLLAHALQRWIAPRYTVAALTGLTMFLGAYWYYDAQLTLDAEPYPDMDEKSLFFQEVVALIPSVRDNTLILYDCPTPPEEGFRWSFESTYALRYLYGYGEGSRVQMAQAQYQTYTAEGVTHTAGYDRPAPISYGYDEMIFLRCDTDGLQLVVPFPPGYAPGDAPISTYDPFGRITGGFIPRGRALPVAR